MSDTAPATRRRNSVPGLTKRGRTWHIDKVIEGRRINRSTGTADLAVARRVLADTERRVLESRKLGMRPTYTFAQGVEKYIAFNANKATLCDDKTLFNDLLGFGRLAKEDLATMNRATLEPFIEWRMKTPTRRGTLPRISTVNHYLAAVRHLLNQAAGEWFDAQGQTWIPHAPKIKLLSAKKEGEEPFRPTPITWEEQDRLFAALPGWLRDMALFTVNTGCRDGEVTALRWDWLVEVPALDTFMFKLPKEHSKNGRPRVIVPNRVAREVVERQRGRHAELVFANSVGKPVYRMGQKAWRSAREAAELPTVRVHDLRHTAGYRMEDAGIDEGTIGDVLGHTGKTVTSRYTAAGLRRLLDAVEAIAEPGGAEVILIRLDD